MKRAAAGLRALARSGAPALLWRTALVAALVCGIGLLPWLSRTDPALTVLRARSADRDPTPETLLAIRDQLGLDDGPLPLLGRWLAGLLHGDAGTSWVSGSQVLPGVAPALGVSLLLMAGARVVAAGTAAGWGRAVPAGRRRPCWPRCPSSSSPRCWSR
jgi:peptide/nickel transport system permease protein